MIMRFLLYMPTMASPPKGECSFPEHLSTRLEQELSLKLSSPNMSNVSRSLAVLLPVPVRSYRPPFRRRKVCPGGTGRY